MQDEDRRPDEEQHRDDDHHDEQPPCQPVQPAPAAVCGTLPECDLYQRGLDKGYSMRRAIYIGVTTAFCLISSSVLVFLHYDGPMATQYISAAMSLAGTICICYLTAGAIDKQRFLERLGDGFGRRRDGDGDGDHK